MAGTPTRCGFCGRQTVTRSGRCPLCGQRKTPPAVMQPPAPPSAWRGIGGQIGSACVAVLLIVTAILIGSQVLLFLAILALCAMAVLFVVAHSAE